MLKMEKVHVIRHLYRNEKMSERAIARRLGIHQDTVRKCLRVSDPIYSGGSRPATWSRGADKAF